MTFEHILSKVFFTVTTGDDHKAYVLALGFDNLHKKNTYTIGNPGAWGTIDVALDSFSYYNGFTPLTGTDTYEEKEFTDVTRADFWAPADPENKFMMLMPQTPKTWWQGVSPNASAVPGSDEAYVRMLYRAEEINSSNKDFIGYESATTHPNYGTSSLKDNYTGSLYVLVGYKYASTWVSGKGYEYEIPLPGATGGKLLDEFLYDDQGNQTELPVIGGKVPDDIISSDIFIHLFPIVTDWDDTGNPTPIQ
jgi:hypothetical protein